METGRILDRHFTILQPSYRLKTEALTHCSSVISATLPSLKKSHFPGSSRILQQTAMSTFHIFNHVLGRTFSQQKPVIRLHTAILGLRLIEAQSKSTWN